MFWGQHRVEGPVLKAFLRHGVHVSGVERDGGLIIVSPRKTVFNEVLNNKVG